MTPRQGRIALVAAALLAALAGFGLAHELDRKAPQLASGTWLPTPRQIGDFRLTDTRGQPFTQQDLRGRASLVYFGYTHCPDVCPTTLVKLAAVVRKVHVAPLQVLFITVDPERDTLPVLDKYVHAFHPDFIGLRPDSATLTRLAKRFSVVVSKVPMPGGDYTMDHSAVVFLLDGNGEMVALFTQPFDIDHMAQDLTRAAPDLDLGD